MTFPGWDRKLLIALGADARPEQLRFIRAWQHAEGGTAHFNPLNTTYKLPGATTYNSVGVRNYPDELSGLAAHLLTLRLPYYARLVAAIRSPTLTAEQILEAGQTGIRTWGTSTNLIAGVLRTMR